MRSAFLWRTSSSGLENGLDNLSSEERRDILHLIVDQITVDRDNNVSITLGIPTEDLVSIEKEESRRK